MGYREQKRLLEELKPFIGKMSPADSDSFKLLQKREKDEEDFDTLSMERLRALHSKYFTAKPRKDFNSLFKPREDNTEGGA